MTSTRLSEKSLSLTNRDCLLDIWLTVPPLPRNVIYPICSCVQTGNQTGNINFQIACEILCQSDYCSQQRNPSTA
ncbi:unnamed protein product [Heterobilharzia americana]|nr:unnamed protein product [Heterobilharzia americana]